MNQQILFVDDEPNILMAFRRQLRSEYQIETANSARDALQLIMSGKKFAVIVSDLRMPVMDGVQFFTQVKKSLPDSVRILLTGHADLSTAIDAINHGDIFRFLTKPCPPETVKDALEAGLKQHRLVNLERDLLEETLGKTVTLMSNMLILANPTAYSQSIRIRHLVKQINHTLKFPGGWQFELAALLSQTGCVALSDALLEKVHHDQPLTEKEKELFDSHPSIGYKLLVNIPRLESIALMIRDQQRPYSSFAEEPYSYQSHEIELGAKILKVVLDYDKLFQRGISHDDIIQDMLRKTTVYDSELVDALSENEIIQDSWERKLSEMIISTGSAISSQNRAMVLGDAIL